jgi:hypothetical protein
MPRLYIPDAQAALGFLIEQASHIEAEVYKIAYPDIQYPQLIPVDTSAPEWAKSVTFYSMDKAGRAEWFHGAADDLRLADVSRAKHEQTVEMAGIGYQYTLEELGQAMMIPGMNLTADKAEAARRAYEEFVDNVALNGDTNKNITGLANNGDVTAAMANVVSNKTDWDSKTGDQIIQDVNDALTGVYSESLQVEMADTVLLPVASLTKIATMARSATTDTSVLEWLSKYNVYTATTGQPLTVRAMRGLEAAGDGDGGRMIVYRKDPRVLKMHIPMPHRFLPVFQTGPVTFQVPGIFRLAGVDIRRPGAVRYIDGIVTNIYS